MVDSNQSKMKRTQGSQARLKQISTENDGYESSKFLQHVPNFSWAMLLVTNELYSF